MSLDIHVAIERLGLNSNSYRLSCSVPPHTITAWYGPDPQPTDAELQAAWDAYEAEGGSAKEEAQSNRASAYAQETDHIYLKFERGEGTKADWEAKVSEIKARYPYPE